MNLKAAKTSALLCLLFLLVYGGTNRLTAFRPDVPSCYFAWERRIPFVPLMIVPYMSIDLFFVAAPFLCRDDRQRRTLARRLVAAITIAALCFILFPLRFAFDRPHLDGVLGLVFNHFRTLDQPFNQFPSLHIAQQIILLGIFTQGSSSLRNVAVRVWFVLIALSTLLTWQHHVIDVIGGAVLGILCVHLFQETPLRQPFIANRRVGSYYAAGSGILIVAAIAIVIAPLPRLILLWPAMSLALIACGYFSCGAGIFRKNHGVLPASTRILLWPTLLGQWLSLAWYKRRSRPWDAVTDRLYIGRKLSRREAEDMIDRAGVSAVLDLTGEFAEAEPFRKIRYCSIPVLDLTAPTSSQLDRAVAFIRSGIESGIVFVHCKAGYSRTAAAAGAYLISSGLADSVEDAIAQLRRARPGMVIRPEIRRALYDYASEQHTLTPPRALAPSPACAGVPSTR